MATIDDFIKIEIRVGQIISAEKIPDTEKLAKLLVDFGEEEKRQVIAGIAPYFADIAVLVGRKFAFATNLDARMIKGFESQAMILATSGGESLSLLSIDDKIPSGSLVK